MADQKKTVYAAIRCLVAQGWEAEEAARGLVENALTAEVRDVNDWEGQFVIVESFTLTPDRPVVLATRYVEGSTEFSTYPGVGDPIIVDIDPGAGGVDDDWRAEHRADAENLASQGYLAAALEYRQIVNDMEDQ